MRVQGRAGTYVDYIHNRIPFPAKLPDLLVRGFQLQGDCMVRPCGLGVYRRKIETPARNRVENAHQCALRVAIADVKDLHVGTLVATRICGNL